MALNTPVEAEVENGGSYISRDKIKRCEEITLEKKGEINTLIFFISHS